MSTETLQIPPPPQAARPAEPLWEIVDGQRVELPEMSGLSNRVKSDLHRILANQVEDSKLGRCDVETVFILDEAQREQRRPDVAFISYERWPADREIEWEGDWKVVPDLCIEITSPNDLHVDVMHKVYEYLDFGVREVWLVDPPERTIQIYRSRTDVTPFKDPDVLISPELLPGIEIPLDKVFAEVPRGGRAPAQS